MTPAAEDLACAFDQQSHVREPTYSIIGWNFDIFVITPTLDGPAPYYLSQTKTLADVLSLPIHTRAC